MKTMVCGFSDSFLLLHLIADHLLSHKNTIKCIKIFFTINYCVNIINLYLWNKINSFFICIVRYIFIFSYFFVSVVVVVYGLSLSLFFFYFQISNFIKNKFRKPIHINFASLIFFSHFSYLTYTRYCLKTSITNDKYKNVGVVAVIFLNEVQKYE